jgi:DNA-binding transcriptional LysR family regulator
MTPRISAHGAERELINSMRAIARIDRGRPAHFLPGGRRARRRIDIASAARARLTRAAPMNVHHLELFYYVAKHGGISAAVRQIPYGIQQPAVSGQMRLLEEDAGTKLFERSPFKLTAAGARLFAHIEPFFSNLGAVKQQLGSADPPPLRVGASEVVLRTHLPAVLERLRHSHPRVRLKLRSGFDTELADWLRDGEVDLIITPMPGRPPPRTRHQRLLRLPLVMLVPKKWKLSTAEKLWANRRPEAPLISLPERESASVVFQRGLRKRGVTWPVAIEASSLDLITQYVADGRGAGVSVMLPEFLKHPRVRVLPLEDFDSLEVVAMWNGEVSPLVRALLEEGRRYTQEHWPAWASDAPK